MFTARSHWNGFIARAFKSRVVSTVFQAIPCMKCFLQQFATFVSKRGIFFSVAAKKEQGRLPPQQSQLSLLSFKDSPYRVRKPYPRITITWSHSSSININNTNIKKTIVSPSPSSTSMKLGSSISHSSSSVSLLSPLSPIEDCSVATGCVDERKPFDIDAWILSYSRQENTSPALKRPSTEDLHESHLTVKQALSCEADLRVQYLETGASVVSCNDASSVSRDDEHDKEITKVR